MNVHSVAASCAVKLISNLVGMTNLAVLAEGLRLGRTAGLDMKQLLELLTDTGARSFQMDVRGPWIAGSDFSPRFALTLAHKDLRLGTDMAHKWKEYLFSTRPACCFRQRKRRGWVMRTAPRS